MTSNSTEKTTHFGYQQVPIEQKSKKVAKVFNSVAENYDLMNDVMSLGIHRLWKFITLQVCNIQPGAKVLDIAGGTGDLAAGFAKKVGEQGSVFLADINAAMLTYGRDKLINQGYVNNIEVIQANAEHLPFASNYFDLISIGFGLRNVTDKPAALRSMYRCLKPGGMLLVLEFSKPIIPGFDQVYDYYSFSVLPELGRWIANDADSYRYLAESIRMHPDQETLKSMITQAGFDQCEYYNLTGGIVALHKAYKY